jgi:hypothetical protein
MRSLDHRLRLTMPIPPRELQQLLSIQTSECDVGLSMVQVKRGGILWGLLCVSQAALL